MQNKYLEVLELEPGATTKDIKAAYRRLSKKYHPDVSQSTDAREKFIKISEAYKFLTKVGPFPHEEDVAYDYNPQAVEFEFWRRQARDYAMWKAREAEKRQSDMIRSILAGFNAAVLLMLLFNVLLAFDFFLPPKEIELEVKQVVPVYEESGSRTVDPEYRYDDVYFSGYQMRFEARRFKYDHNEPRGVGFFTPLFQKPISYKAVSNSEAVTYFHVYNVFRVCGFIIPIILGALFLYKFVIKSLDPQLSLALFTLFTFLFQVYLFFRF